MHCTPHHLHHSTHGKGHGKGAGGATMLCVATSPQNQWLVCLWQVNIEHCKIMNFNFDKWIVKDKPNTQLLGGSGIPNTTTSSSPKAANPQQQPAISNNSTSNTIHVDGSANNSHGASPSAAVHHVQGSSGAQAGLASPGGVQPLWQAT